MPVDEDGTTEITIAGAWPMHWAYRSDNDPAVPYIAADTLLQQRNR
ncbi:hypothetical protein [Thioalkalivibrio sp. HK1]|nr:hypothetical protein [Thioalkalivibrio sp. HK1]